ncbi:hypothetical protein FEM48_Zijuj02G0024600 [Ziziphus jujuba var. spinosa]|uniref:Uncharacterized protein n=1 Tax=Ziziphus jujuba var. spinosa TaxID=714518 RepID=A0A978VT33_ZIZJJ|nr:hypothetical protein FEM48_Zijuj02G0024600 [Ziziphus jujuba var. spinosa]
MHLSAVHFSGVVVGVLHSHDLFLFLILREGGLTYTIKIGNLMKIKLLKQALRITQDAVTDLGTDKFGLSDEHALSLLAAKKSKAGPSYGQAHAAAVHMQKKYHGWKKRKEFLIKDKVNA